MHDHTLRPLRTMSSSCLHLLQVLFLPRTKTHDRCIKLREVCNTSGTDGGAFALQRANCVFEYVTRAGPSTLSPTQIRSMGLACPVNKTFATEQDVLLIRKHTGRVYSPSMSRNTSHEWESIKGGSGKRGSSQQAIDRRDLKPKKPRSVNILSLELQPSRTINLSSEQMHRSPLSKVIL